MTSSTTEGTRTDRRIPMTVGAPAAILVTMRTLVALTALMSMTTLAAAQAPGATEPAPPPAATGGQQPPPRSVMRSRWAITFGVVWEALKVEAEPMPKTAMTMFDLSAHYRIRRPFELGLAVLAGGANAGDLDTARMYIDGRWRFLAEKPWNVYARFGIGVAAVANDQASKQERAGRGSIHLGAGVERRWGWFALSAELRLVGIGENPDAPAPPTLSPAYQFARNKVSGGAFSIASNFYF